MDSLERLWGSRAVATTGRPPQLSLERVVNTAVEIADADGLEAVSMAGVAKRLGFTPMSLYRHVSGKDELVALMVDAAVGAPPAPADEAWRAALERWAWELLRVVRRHPWLLTLPLAHLPVGPQRFGWLDRGLAALAEADAAESARASIVRLLNGYVFSEALFASAAADGGQGSDAIAGGAEAVASLVSAERFPALRRALDAGALDPVEDESDAAFAFGLARLLDGVELFLAAGDD